MDLSITAAGQHHAFTAAQAMSCGHTWRTIAAEVDAKRWLDLVRGVYVERTVWDSLDREQQHKCVVHGRLLKKVSGWAAARRSAAVVHGVPFLGFPPERPQLLRDRGASKSRAHSRHERIDALPTRDVESVDGLCVTTLPRTWGDIASEEPFRNAVVLGDGVLRRGITRESLIERATTASARRAAEFADPLAESALEPISRVGCLALGLPIPMLQVKVIYAGKVVARADAAWKELNVLGQADGALKYKDSDRVVRDKWQDEDLESLGFVVVRWGWDEAWQQRRLGVKLERAFERGRARSIVPGVTLVQATLAESLQVRRVT